MSILEPEVTIGLLFQLAQVEETGSNSVIAEKTAKVLGFLTLVVAQEWISTNTLTYFNEIVVDFYVLAWHLIYIIDLPLI